MREARYPIGAVARMTGIGLDRLRVWERRYRAIVPERGVRGRLYTAAQVERLALLRDAVERGHPIGEAAKLDDEQLRELLESPLSTDRPLNDGGLLGPLLNSIERLDHADAGRRIGRLAALLQPRDVVHEVALPLVRAMGRGWEDGRFSVAQEHMVSALLRNLLGSLVRLYPTGDASPRLLLATPSGEWHEFGILSAALLAAGRGLCVVYLGVNLPAPEIVGAAARTSATAVVLGIAGEKPPRGVMAEVGRVARGLAAGTELWIGGPAAVLRLLTMPNLVLLESLDDFERHLQRLGGTKEE